jgi:hypothetical protein
MKVIATAPLFSWRPRRRGVRIVEKVTAAWEREAKREVDEQIRRIT